MISCELTGRKSSMPRQGWKSSPYQMNRPPVRSRSTSSSTPAADQRGDGLTGDSDGEAGDPGDVRPDLRVPLLSVRRPAASIVTGPADAAPERADTVVPLVDLAVAQRAH